MTNHPNRSKKAKKAEETIISIKGFDANLRCRSFQFELGKLYEHDGPVVACESGFHAVDYPLDVFDYYPPATSRYAIVTQAGLLARHDGDTKIASAKITIDAEIKLPDLIARAIKWVFDRAKPEGAGSHATGYRGAASATGYSGAASATGDSGAASATGDSGAASATGNSGRVMGAEGCALFMVYRNSNTWKIEQVWAGIAGRDGIEPLTWYELSAEGVPVKCES